ncbi:hypothetical protein FJQ98_24365 [Lysinibacillus agricola]|uniref:Uncharacterized protein n=1 Tax=Lysinibacillus agricola TaxID=2590012 RepID=A0ABX7AQF4_9BACI|nr:MULTISPECIES: hypothetical protein [Lysinibacillus]KOS63238.1 hypothetical protein AN161_08440 [Lysinibacillus sp. FJAT-14222]QQP12193.1 hypothetical protein FJQ98_24365 [Lysinibacillus agricola]
MTPCESASQIRPWSGKRSSSSDAPQEALLCAKAKRQQQLFSVAKVKRQLQSAQLERKSAPRYDNNHYFHNECKFLWDNKRGINSLERRRDYEICI